MNENKAPQGDNDPNKGHQRGFDREQSDVPGGRPDRSEADDRGQRAEEESQDPEPVIPEASDYSDIERVDN